MSTHELAHILAWPLLALFAIDPLLALVAVTFSIASVGALLLTVDLFLDQVING